MRSISRVLLGTVASVVLAGLSLAQSLPTGKPPPGPIANPMRGYPPLYQNVGIQQALKFTPKQINQLNQAYEASRGKFQKEFNALASLPQHARLAGWQSYQRAVHNDFFQGLGNYLTPAQVKGYGQIYLQQLGPAAFSDPQLQTNLDLSKGQVRKFRNLGEIGAKELRGLYQTKMPTGAASQRWDALQRKVAEGTTKVLNTNQVQLWQEMTGEAYQFQMRSNLNPGQ